MLEEVAQQRLPGPRLLFASALLLAAPGCGGSKPASGGFEAARPGERAYSPPDAGVAPTRVGSSHAPAQRPLPPGHISPIGPVFAEEEALEDIVAGALAGLRVSDQALPGTSSTSIMRGLARRAGMVASGLGSVGPLMWAELKAGERAEGMLVLESGRCYAIVGYATNGVSDYRINLLAAPPVPPSVLAQSAAGSADPTIGGTKQCLKHTRGAPLHVWVDLHLVGGQGIVAARAYAE
jgi:hypothetical protein